MPRLNRSLVLEARERVPDGHGGVRSGWRALGSLWGQLKAGAARETGLGGLPGTRVQWRITVRGSPEGSLARPVAGQRFAMGARRFRIVAVAEADVEGRYLLCHASEEEVRT
ncbi:head-tail adaptor protein [Roseicyclus sp. F158]|uniref:Head-tail adaptor protein n=2 Tax=Tropicimonas omnivorans TaxID=3075590 RepID=A0ABU3DIR7_9RHOB|nr:head-tail adaptor protein [Roseicyclus sp. F158]MDT0683615.1 head-tail adaptor protein [Roseicyclus sp. F158]